MNNIISQEEKNQIDALCKQYSIKNYTINPDGSIDVDGDVVLNEVNLTKLPLAFGRVLGNFYCSDNRLTSLEGCPNEVGGRFDCSFNQLTSMVGAPVSVGRDFYSNENLLTSLEGCPKTVGGGFWCDGNKLTSLKGCPNEVGGDFDCSDNTITSLEYCPTKFGESFIVPEHLPMAFVNTYFDLYTERDNFVDPLILTDGQRIFLKYQHYYDVWAPEFSEENMQLLIDDIKDGLQ